MRSQLQRLALAASAALLLASAAQAGTKGYVQIAGLMGPVKDQGHAGWYEMPNHTIDFLDDGTCDVKVQAIMQGGVTGLIHKMDLGNEVATIKIELVDTVKGNQTYYQAELTDVHLKKITSRSVWGGAFEELQLEPDSIHLEQKRQTPQGFFEPAGQVDFDCGTSRVP